MNDITSKKDSKKYTILKGLAEDGSVIEVFMNEDQSKQFPVSKDSLVTPQEVAEFFEKFRTVDVQFDQRGRLVSVTE